MTNGARIGLPMRLAAALCFCLGGVKAADFPYVELISESSFVCSGFGVDRSLDDDPNVDYTAFKVSSNPAEFSLGLYPSCLKVTMEVLFESAENYATDWTVIALDRQGRQVYRREMKDRTGQLQRFSIPANKPFCRLNFSFSGYHGQNRLLMRKVAIKDCTQVRRLSGDASPFLALCEDVSQMRPYGNGVSGVVETTPDAWPRLLAGKDWQCGNYTLAMVRSLPPGTRAVRYGIWQMRTDAHHNVLEVEVDGVKYTYDPTQGIVYEASIAELIGGASYSEAIRSGFEPQFELYTGGEFFFNGIIISQGPDVSTLKDLSRAEVRVGQLSYDYTGAAICPTVSSVTVDGAVLKPGEDYAVTYRDNVMAGQACLTISGRGNCFGEKSVRFSILPIPVDMSGVSFADRTYEYDGRPKSLSVSGILPTGVTVRYSGNGVVEAGTYIVTASFVTDSNHVQPPSLSANLTIRAEPPVADIRDGVLYGCILNGNRHFVIPSGVTAIAPMAFYGNAGLRSVTIPASVISIGRAAFALCSDLETIRIPPGVDSIPERAFRYCTSLRQVIFDGKVDVIEDYAFADCPSLTSIKIPSGAKVIGNCAFYRDVALQTAGLPSSLLEIGSNAFFGCSRLTSIKIPGNVESVGAAAFSKCTGLRDVYWSKSAATIPSKAFYCCTSLASVIVPVGVVSIEGFAFAGCASLLEIKLPSSCRLIGKKSFGSCRSLTTVTGPLSRLAAASDAFYSCRFRPEEPIARQLSVDGDVFSGSARVGEFSLVLVPGSTVSVTGLVLRDDSGVDERVSSATWQEGSGLGFSSECGSYRLFLERGVFGCEECP